MLMSVLPPQHFQRLTLHNEVHARPPEPSSPGLAVSHLVMLTDAAQREASRKHVAALLRANHLAPPDEGTVHLRADLQGVRLRWELHTEFVTWTFSCPLDGDRFPAAESDVALRSVPADWLAHLPGETLAATHLWLLPRVSCERSVIRRLLHEETLLGSAVAGGAANIYTDFSVHSDGFCRMIVFAADAAPRQLGRLVQQLLEVDTYRMAALLGLPVSREAGALLGQSERELASLANAIRTAGAAEEADLLDRLTKLAGQVEGHHAATHSRLSASAAYFELVDTRLRALAEAPIDGYQTLAEFIDRRLSPARATCEWAARRQEALSQRISRMSNLLRTRVEVEQQRATQEVLSAMNRRQHLQLRLQTTVEGLSVAAITYYVVGLFGYGAKAVKAALGGDIPADVLTAAAIPLVAVITWSFIRRLHRHLLETRR